jgi:hypothetical protein
MERTTRIGELSSDEFGRLDIPVAEESSLLEVSGTVIALYRQSPSTKISGSRPCCFDTRLHWTRTTFP